MSVAQLKRGRKTAGLTQQQAATRLRISQAYLSLIESGRRRAPGELARRLVDLYRLPPTELPLTPCQEHGASNSGGLSRDLGSLGYPGFAYLRPRCNRNPASVLLAALSSPDLEVRVVEALPWLVWRFPEMDWDWLVREAKQLDIQNRLGFVVALARQLREKRAPSVPEVLRVVEARLERARLAGEDTLCQRSLTEPERRWLRNARPPEARHWNLLTDITMEHLPYAA